MSVDNCSTDVPPTLVANPSSSVDCGQHSWRPWDASKPRRVFDMFIVNGEIDLLEARLASLFSIVDVFVAVEASKTHHGAPKLSRVTPHLHGRLKPFAHKIIQVWVDFPHNCALWPWSCENYQRERMLDGFIRSGGGDNDVVVMGDVDEFPRPWLVRAMKSCDFERSKPAVLQLHGDHFWYSARCKRTDKSDPWKIGPTAASGRTVRRFGPNQLRLPYFKWTGVLRDEKGRWRPNPGLGSYRKDPAIWKLLAAELPKHIDVASASAAYFDGTLTTRPYMPKYDPPIELLTNELVDKQPISKSSWHYSYFMTPDEIVDKYRSAVVGNSKKDWSNKPPEWHFKVAMHCSSPQHFSWTFKYVDVLTEDDVPPYVLQNRCRMKPFFRYSREGNPMAALPVADWFQRVNYSSFQCAAGVRQPSTNYCCAASCGVCGGDTCNKRPGGRPLCCPQGILKRGRICSSPLDTGCLISGAPPPEEGAAWPKMRVRRGRTLWE